MLLPTVQRVCSPWWNHRREFRLVDLCAGHSRIFFGSSARVRNLSQRHFARREEIARQLGVSQILGFLTSAAIFAAGGTEPGIAAMVVSNSVNERRGYLYSRTQEREADRIGLAALTSAGYDPMGAVRMFERMKEHYRFDTAGYEAFEFLLTIPLHRRPDIRFTSIRTKRGCKGVREFPRVPIDACTSNASIL